MKRFVLATLLFVLLGGPTCEPSPPPPPPPPPKPPVSTFCHNNEFSAWQAAKAIPTTGEVGAGIEAILRGEPSTDIRSTVFVSFGGAYCTGTALSRDIVLSAGHCGYAATTLHDIRVYKRETAPPTGDFAEQEVAFASTATGERVETPAKMTDAFLRDHFAFDAGVLDAVEGGLVRTATIRATRHIVHPDYMKYLNSGNTDLEGRKADLMLLKLSTPLPDDVEPVMGVYNEAWAKLCSGMKIQGFGRHEGSTLDLREAPYVVTNVYEKLISSRSALVPVGELSGLICFGDSGGPGYCEVGGVVYLCGVTTTTMSQDCLAGGTHVKVHHFWDAWVKPTMIEISTT